MEQNPRATEQELKAAEKLLEMGSEMQALENELSPKMRIWVKKLKEVLQEAEELDTLKLVAVAATKKKWLTNWHTETVQEEEAAKR